MIDLIGGAGGFRGDDCLVQLPTGVGKTKSIEFIIQSGFIENRISNVVVIAPLKALCNEISVDLNNVFKDVASVNTLSDVLQNDLVLDFFADIRNKNIIVCTPEKFSYIIKNNNILDFIDLFIFDEAHLFMEEGRGVEYELLLTTIKLLSREDSQKILISAVLPDIDKLNEWFFKSEASIVKSNSIRTTEKSKGFINEDYGQIHLYSTDFKEEDCFIPRLIERNKLNKLPRERVDKFFPEKGNSFDIALYFSDLLYNNGNIAIYVYQTASIKTIINRLEELLKRSYKFNNVKESNNIELAKIKKLIDEHYGKDYWLYKGLGIGVGGHYKGIENGIKISQEYALREGDLKIIVCTSTLSQGINLPIKYLILTSLYENGTIMSIPKFQNLIGRTARSGKYTEGTVIVTNSKHLKQYRTSGSKFLNFFPENNVQNLFNANIGNEIYSSISNITNVEIELIDMKDPIKGLTSYSLFTTIVDNYNDIDVFNNIKYSIIRRKLYVNERHLDEINNVLKKQEKIYASLESYIAFYINSNITTKKEDTNDFKLYEKYAQEFIDATLANLLNIGIYKTENYLNKLAYKIAEKVFSLKDNSLNKIVPKSFEGYNNVFKILNHVSDNIEVIENNFEQFIFDALYFIIPNIIKKIDIANLKLIAQNWINGVMIKDFATKYNYNGNYVTISINELEKTFNTLSFEYSNLIGIMLDAYETISENEEISNKFKSYQNRFKYGLPNNSSIKLYEVGFQDRFLAQRISLLFNDEISDNDIKSQKLEIHDIIKDYPSIFIEKLNKL